MRKAKEKRLQFSVMYVVQLYASKLLVCHSHSNVCDQENKKQVNKEEKT